MSREREVKTVVMWFKRLYRWFWVQVSLNGEFPFPVSGQRLGVPLGHNTGLCALDFLASWPVSKEEPGVKPTDSGY